MRKNRRCPMCGEKRYISELSGPQDTGEVMFACGTIRRSDNSMGQSHRCLIRERNNLDDRIKRIALAGSAIRKLVRIDSPEAVIATEMWDDEIKEGKR